MIKKIILLCVLIAFSSCASVKDKVKNPLKKCPPASEDFPDIVHDGMNIYNSLGNRVYQDVGFVGKDFTNLERFYELYQIDHYEKAFLMKLMLFLEHRDVDSSQKAIKAAYDKAKRK